MTDVQTPVTQALDALAIPYTLHLHKEPIRSLEQAAAARGLQPAQIVRSLLFRMEDSAFVLLLMPGPDPVDWPKLRHYLRVSRITTATEEEVRQVTGFVPGAVSPFGLEQPLPLLADRAILDLETISLGAGIRNAGVVLARAEAMAALQPDLGEFK
ncbi:MAG: YbaK/EbsC family protein [Anaerolineales bacterium]